jgi:hypothetical protein
MGAQVKRHDSELNIDYMTMRQFVGWLGVLLPIIVYLGNWAFFTHHVASCLMPSSHVPYSLSGYYYTHMRGIFTGTFWALGIVLVTYKGYDIWDQLITTVAGLAAIGIATFPTQPPAAFLAAQRGLCGPLVPIVYNSSSNQTLVGYGHQISLILLLAALFAMALQFRRKGSPAEQAAKSSADQRRKRINNRIYLVSAIGILIGGAGAVAQNFMSAAMKAETPWLFWFEIVAIFAFGLAWFVKGASLSRLVKLVKTGYQKLRKPVSTAA